MVSYCWSAAFPSTRHRRCFKTFGAPLGQYLFAMPDGEVGPRRHWISRVHYQVLAGHPELDVVQRPAPERTASSGSFRAMPRDAWWFKVKDGVEQVRFGDPGWRLGYARDAINSYFVFKTLAARRACLPPHLRFQVSLAMVNSVLPPRIFPNRADLDKIRPGLPRRRRAPRSPRSSRTSRPSDLAIQWDCSTEVQDAYGAVPGFPLEGAIERNRRAVAQPVAAHPREVALGYHFCFGTLGGWPRFAPDDLGQAVSSPTPSSRPPAGGSTGSTFRCLTAATTRSSRR